MKICSIASPFLVLTLSLFLILSGCTKQTDSAPPPYSADSLNAILEDFRLSDPGRMRAFFDPPQNVPQDSTKFISDTKVIYRDGSAQLPAQLQNKLFSETGWFTTFNMQLSNPYDPLWRNARVFCFMEQGYSVEWRLKMPNTPVNGYLLTLASYFDFSAIFRRVNGQTFLTGYSDFDKNLFGYENGSNQFSTILVSPTDLFHDFTKVKLQADLDRFTIFVNDIQAFQFARKNPSVLLDPHFYVDAGFFGNAGLIDYVKLFDKNGIVKFEENFDAPGRPARPNPTLICPTPVFTCEKAFTDYFNLRSGTGYTYDAIAAMYLAETGTALKVCQ